MIIDFKDVQKSITNSSRPYLYLFSKNNKNNKNNKNLFKTLYIANEDGYSEAIIPSELEPNFNKGDFYFIECDNNSFVKYFYDVINKQKTTVDLSVCLERHYCEIFGVENFDKAFDLFHNDFLREVFSFVSSVKKFAYYDYRCILMCALKNLDEHLNNPKVSDKDQVLFGSDYGYCNYDCLETLDFYYKNDQYRNFIVKCCNYFYPYNYSSELENYLSEKGFERFSCPE